jgi:hypothetical protein
MSDHGPIIAVDFDRTIAHHRNGQEELGKPIMPMLNRVKRWVKEGQEVWIFTARASSEDQRRKIQDWLEEHGLPRLPVTNEKSPRFVRMYDDKAVAVAPNGGTLLTERRSSHRISRRK